jgi:uncharacterized protein YkwD
MHFRVLNTDNGDMHRIAAVGVVALVVAGCGGGGSDKAAAPTKSGSSPGGVVTADATKGLVGPAASVLDGKSTEVGKTEPLSPKENRPTDAERNGVAGGAPCASTSSSPASSNLGAMSSAILCLLNGERAAKGLPPLSSNGSLAKAAKGWANKMVAARFFAHETRSSTVLSRIKKTGYVRGSWSLGENIAWGSGGLDTPRAIVNGWMHSPGHRANILRSKFKDIGIGIKLGAPGRGLSGGATYVTDFGRHG